MFAKNSKGLVSNSLHGWSFTRGWSSKHKLKSGTYQIYHTLEGAVGSPYILSFIHAWTGQLRQADNYE